MHIIHRETSVYETKKPDLKFSSDCNLTRKKELNNSFLPTFAVKELFVESSSDVDPFYYIGEPSVLAVLIVVVHSRRIATGSVRADPRPPVGLGVRVVDEAEPSGQMGDVKVP